MDLLPNSVFVHSHLYKHGDSGTTKFFNKHHNNRNCLRLSSRATDKLPSLRLGSQMRGSSIVAFLQQAEANLALISSQLEESARCKPPWQKDVVSPVSQEVTEFETEVKEQLAVQARTLLGFERRLQKLEQSPSAQLGQATISRLHATHLFPMPSLWSSDDGFASA
eukprot:s3510_g7.t1